MHLHPIPKAHLEIYYNLNRLQWISFLCSLINPNLFLQGSQVKTSIDISGLPRT